MSESFSEMFEQSLANQRIRPGMILMGLVIDVTPDVVINTRSREDLLAWATGKVGRV